MAKYSLQSVLATQVLFWISLKSSIFKIALSLSLFGLWSSGISNITINTVFLSSKLGLKGFIFALPALVNVGNLLSPSSIRPFLMAL